MRQSGQEKSDVSSQQKTSKKSRVTQKGKAVRRGTAATNIALSVHSGLLEGAFFPLTKKHNVIGRNIDANIPIKDSKVSREHAAIDLDKGAFFIRDLGSTNGTFVNNERVDDSKRISIGDSIRIGAYTFRVEPYHQNKAQGQAYKWSSETKFLFRDSALRNSPELAGAVKSGPSSRARAESHTIMHDIMKHSSVKALAGIDAEKIKWLLLALGIFLVFAATFTRFHHFS